MAPRSFQPDGGDETSLLYQSQEAVEVGGRICLPQCVEEVEGVDVGARHSVESRGSKGDDLLWAARGDIDDRAAWCEVLDRRGESCSSDCVDGQVELAADLIDDGCGAQPP